LPVLKIILNLSTTFQNTAALFGSIIKPARKNFLTEYTDFLRNNPDQLKEIIIIT
jgi:hypothetical protein